MRLGRSLTHAASLETRVQDWSLHTSALDAFVATHTSHVLSLASWARPLWEMTLCEAAPSDASASVDWTIPGRVSGQLSEALERAKCDTHAAGHSTAALPADVHCPTAVSSASRPSQCRVGAPAGLSYFRSGRNAFDVLNGTIKGLRAQQAESMEVVARAEAQALPFVTVELVPVINASHILVGALVSSRANVEDARRVIQLIDLLQIPSIVPIIERAYEFLDERPPQVMRTPASC